MTDRTREVDWDQVERRGRRQFWLAVPAFIGFWGAVIVLTGGVGSWEGAHAWAFVGLLLAPLVVFQVVAVASPRLRARMNEGQRVQYAIRHRLDPGPGAREKADVYARRMAANRWAGWLVPLVLVSFFTQGRWDRPLLAVPAALVLVAAVVAYVLWWRRQAAAAQRWVADPPGPDREAPPLTWQDRWLTGRRAVWLVLGFALVNVLFVTVVVLSLAAG